MPELDTSGTERRPPQRIQIGRGVVVLVVLKRSQTVDGRHSSATSSEAREVYAGDELGRPSSEWPIKGAESFGIVRGHFIMALLFLLV